jgi:hypothetical protein
MDHCFRTKGADPLFKLPGIPEINDPHGDGGKSEQISGGATKQRKDAVAGIVAQQFKQGGPKSSGGSRQNQPMRLFFPPAEGGGSHAREQKSRITEIS